MGRGVGPGDAEAAVTMWTISSILNLVFVMVYAKEVTFALIALCFILGPLATIPGIPIWLMFMLG